MAVMLQGAGQLYWVICANEEMARFMILADALLAAKDKVGGWHCSHGRPACFWVPGV
jgi:hypothetical protein